YAFGVVLFQMCSGGGLPFVPPAGLNPPRAWSALFELHSRAAVPHLKSPLDQVIARCLEKKPARRYATFADVRADLERLGERNLGIRLFGPHLKELEGWEWNNRGVSLEALGRMDEARTCYDAAIDLNPRLNLAWYNKANLAFRDQQIEVALSLFDQAIALDC